MDNCVGSYQVKRSRFAIDAVVSVYQAVGRLKYSFAVNGRMPQIPYKRTPFVSASEQKKNKQTIAHTISCGQ
jgi:hypothetical protein